MICEMWDALEAHKKTPAWGGAAIAAIGIVMLAAMLIAALGPVFSTPLRTGSNKGLDSALCISLSCRERLRDERMAMLDLKQDKSHGKG